MRFVGTFTAVLTSALLVVTAFACRVRVPESTVTAAPDRLTLLRMTDQQILAEIRVLIDELDRRAEVAAREREPVRQVTVGDIEPTANSVTIPITYKDVATGEESKLALKCSSQTSETSQCAQYLQWLRGKLTGTDRREEVRFYACTYDPTRRGSGFVMELYFVKPNAAIASDVFKLVNTFNVTGGEVDCFRAESERNARL